MSLLYNFVNFTYLPHGKHILNVSTIKYLANTIKSRYLSTTLWLLPLFCILSKSIQLQNLCLNEVAHRQVLRENHWLVELG